MGGRRCPSRTLTEALLAQCRAEGPHAYRLLTAASVLEQPFEPEPLAEVLDADPTELTEELKCLCERRILRIDGLRFRFRYQLVREVSRETYLSRTQTAAATAPPPPAHRDQPQDGLAGRMTAIDTAHDLISGTCFEHSTEPAYVMDPGPQLRPRRERRRWCAARLHARGTAADADLQHPPGRARAAR